MISIIVPVYNNEKYLSECIESILSNTYSKFELILVDDGSIDSSGRICDKYLKLDCRIKVIHQENKGVSEARNSGLRIAKGNYISFVDADDIISPMFYEIMINEIKNNGADIVACQYTHQKEKLDICINKEYKVYSTKDFEEMLSLIVTSPAIQQISWTSCYVWNKIYRREKISCFFEERYVMTEDLKFNYDFIEKCTKFTTISANLYYYRANEESICNRYKKDYANQIEQGISNAHVWKKISEREIEDTELRQYLIARAVYTTHGALFRIYVANKQKKYKEYIKTSKKFISQEFYNLWKDKSTYSIRVRLIIGIYCYLFPIWRLAILIYQSLMKK